jgi:hypothetical protein
MALAGNIERERREEQEKNRREVSVKMLLSKIMIQTKTNTSEANLV